MAMTMYKIEEGKVAPRVPEFLRGKFFELHEDYRYDEDGIILNPDNYVGWVHISTDGTIEFGEPGA